MQIQSRHFGVIDVEENKMLQFPRGIIGFPEAKSFCLLSIPEIEPYQWLHCVNDPQLAFLVVPVAALRPDYRVQLSAEECRQLGFEPDEPALALGIVVLPEDPQQATVDLLAPLVVNERTRQGLQAVNEHGGYTTRHRIKDEMHRAREGRNHAGTDEEKEAIADARR